MAGMKPQWTLVVSGSSSSVGAVGPERDDAGVRGERVAAATTSLPGFMQPTISGTPSPSRSPAARPPPADGVRARVHLSTSAPSTIEMAWSVPCLQ